MAKKTSGKGHRLYVSKFSHGPGHPFAVITVRIGPLNTVLCVDRIRGRRTHKSEQARVLTARTKLEAQLEAAKLLGNGVRPVDVSVVIDMEL